MTHSNKNFNHSDSNERRRLLQRRLNPNQSVLDVEQARDLPAIGQQDGRGDEAVAYVKFFCGPFTWYAIELDASTGTFFGLVDNANMRDQMPEGELGYFTVDELTEIRMPLNLSGMTFHHPVERDIHFEPTMLGEIRGWINPERQQRVTQEDGEAAPSDGGDSDAADPKDAEIERLRGQRDALLADNRDLREKLSYQAEGHACALDMLESAHRRIAELEAELSAAKAVNAVSSTRGGTKANQADTDADAGIEAKPARTPRGLRKRAPKAPARRPQSLENETDEDRRRLIAAVHV